MERWEQELAAELRAAENEGAATSTDNGGDSSTGEQQNGVMLKAAFHAVVRRVGESVARIAEAAGVQPVAVEEKELNRYRWSLQGRHLRIRLDREAQKLFVSVESDTGLALCNLWMDEGRLLTDADGAVHPADIGAIVRPQVTLLFRGNTAETTSKNQGPAQD